MSNQPRPPGRIVTFYSYKGGTGRSMAVANIAWILASNQRRVLVIDWDLEAPGLHRYFHPFLEDKELEECPGIIDYFVDFAASARDNSKEQTTNPAWYEPFTDLVGYSRSLDWDFGDGYLDFVPAGRQGPAYGVRVSQFNWEEFYARLGGGLLLEALKQRLREEYDYVLIDSRTGISDTSGICTVQMPDELVTCFTLNRQSILGAAAVAKSASDQRRKPSGDAGLRVWPVPMRVEMFEKERLERARDLAHATFAPFLKHVRRSERQAYWGGIEVLYHPYFAYEEVLATFADRRLQTGSLLASLEQIARRISDVNGLGEMSEADRQRGLALYLERGRAPAVPRSRRLFLAYSMRDINEADRLARYLHDRLGHDSVFFDQQSLALGEDWRLAIDEALKGAQVVLAVIGPEFLLGGPGETYTQQLTAAHGLNKRIVPVIVGDARVPLPEELPEELSWLPNLNGIFLSKDDYESGVKRLQEGIGRLFADTPSAEVIDPDDPQKGRWGGRAAANGRALRARVSELTPTWFDVELTVVGDASRPLTGSVTFHLHPTCQPPEQTVQVENGTAGLKLQLWGAFTVGASADNGRTQLELDLAAQPDAPVWFREH